MSISEFFKKIFSPLVFGNCLGAIVLTAILGVGAFFCINLYTRHNQSVTVPDICGLDEQVAYNKLKALGLNMEVTDTGYVFRAAARTVLEQSIEAGKEVKKGRTILITINANGPRQIAIPDVADNCSRREAEDKLTILGFKLGATEYIVGDPEWVYGVKVNGRNVSSGTKVSVTSPITLVVGSGGLEEEYNGNDSLDYILNGPDEEDEGEYFEDETSDASAKEDGAPESDREKSASTDTKRAE